MKFTKANTSVELRAFDRTNKETGEITPVKLIFLNVDERDEPLALSLINKSVEDTVEYMKSNPDWRSQVQLAKSTFRKDTYYAYINQYVSNVEVQTLDV